MKKWLILSAAILLEVTATLSLRGAIDNPWWSILAVVGYAGAFVALTAVLASLVFGEQFTFTIGLGIAIVIAGVVLVETGHAAESPKPAATNEEVGA